ncbi:MAG: pyrimidine/purine nucleoside phosphorylase [Halothiobacillaceae bacterium]|jgi:uncharacterized protein YaiE (UPF0345 family)|nr:pyrimidine/purine nucleoside phosphorylase [Halothiobacillaceae bacterium]MDY0050095.1 pyrimidine/purine nucleoside phosphorylase [Halothiobacillaceae bacterium]
MFKINEYFEGKVKSIGFQTESLPATVGVMAPGEYVFSTSRKETMKIISGAMRVRLPGSETWTRYGEGESFEVPAEAKFDVALDGQTAYLCLYH